MCNACWQVGALLDSPTLAEEFINIILVHMPYLVILQIISHMFSNFEGAAAALGCGSR